jgi:hypothetical protein
MLQTEISTLAVDPFRKNDIALAPALNVRFLVKNSTTNTK